MLDVHYPTSDGKPMGETDAHRDQIISLIKALEYYYADDPNVYVSGNILMFYEEGNGRKHRSPDVLVALEVKKGERESYKIWEEGKAPDVVFEITSKSTRTEDLGEKKGLYALLGVREYVIFDLLNEYLEPGLQLYRLQGDQYSSVTEKLVLETLGLELLVQDGALRLRDGSGDVLLTPEERVEEQTRLADEQTRRAEEEARRADKQAERATQAEAEVQRLKEQIEALRRVADSSEA
jgi:Uma2 family endonuclease